MEPQKPCGIPFQQPLHRLNKLIIKTPILIRTMTSKLHSKNKHSIKNVLKNAKKATAPRRAKTVAVLAQQAVLNTVLLGRKGGVHHSQTKKREQLLNIYALETLRDLNTD